jgi:hypothetical protein
MENVLLIVVQDITHLWDIVLLVINHAKIVQLFQLNVQHVQLDILNLESTVFLDAHQVNFSILQVNNAYRATHLVKLVQLKTSVHLVQTQVYNQFKDNVYNVFIHVLHAQAIVFVHHA